MRSSDCLIRPEGRRTRAGALNAPLLIGLLGTAILTATVAADNAIASPTAPAGAAADRLWL